MSFRPTCWWVPACVGLWLAACGDEQPGPAAADGGSGLTSSHLGGNGVVSGSLNAPGGAGGAPASGEGGDTVEALPIGEIGGGNFAESMAGAPASSPPACDPMVGWGNPTPLANINTHADERLLTMTHDELTLVIERAGALLLAERDSPQAPFTAVTPLALPHGYDATRGVSLDAQGLSLVVVSEDGSGFAEITRSKRGAAFGGQPDVARFAAVNDARSFSGGELSSPVLSEDGKTFFYAERRSTRSDVWRATGASLEDREKLDGVTLGSDDGMAKLPLSVSRDLRMLFVFDEALNHVVGLWSPTAAGALTQLVLFRDLQSAFTNGDCSRLYGTRMNDGSLDIVIEAP
jgi:hypothetical protein